MIKQDWKDFILSLEVRARTNEFSNRVIAKKIGKRESQIARFFRAEFCPGLNFVMDVSNAINNQLILKENEPNKDIKKGA